jgi:hypothetical protein
MRILLTIFTSFEINPTRDKRDKRKIAKRAYTYRARRIIRLPSLLLHKVGGAATTRINRDDLFLAAGVMLGVSLCSFGGVLLGVRGMAMRDQCVMGSLFDRTSFGVFGGFLMVLRSRFMMLSSELVVFCNLR